MKPSLPATVALLALAAAALYPASAGAQQLPGPAVGAPAPAFTLTTVDGKTVRLDDYRGKTLVINVWGSWCPPCRLETPDLVAEARADTAHGVAFLGVDTTEPASVVRAFSAAKEIPYPQAAVSGTSPFATAYAIRNYPTTFVIGPDGVLRARHADNVLPRAQLHAYIAAAQQNRSAPLTTAFQAQLDALLDPAQYSFDGNAATVRATVLKAAEAISRADDLEDDAMDDASRDHDLIKTQAEQERLRAAAIAALAKIASGDADTAMLDRLRGDEDAALGKWSDADAAYTDALAHSPG
ncbi:MAG TPA: TlpA disulfide reductase family protein, partial [Candidatus Elarobacter sp.]|nr:TlpA disulfide reductase family protein [Candidatus Elarobacter sp.]